MESEPEDSPWQRLDLHVVAQHQSLGVRMQVDLRVHRRCARYKHPVGNGMALWRVYLMGRAM